MIRLLLVAALLPSTALAGECAVKVMDHSEVTRFEPGTDHQHIWKVGRFPLRLTVRQDKTKEGGWRYTLKLEKASKDGPDVLLDTHVDTGPGLDALIDTSTAMGPTHIRCRDDA